MPEQNDREKLIAGLRRQAHSAALRHDTELCNTLWDAAKALAAPPVIDEAKVTTVLLNAETALDDLPYPATVATHLARYLVEHRDEWLGGTR